MAEDLIEIYKWSEENNLSFNCDKFALIRYRTTGSQVDPDYEYLTPTGSIIENVKQTKDLGILMSSDLTFKDHLEIMITKCKQLMGWVLRTFKTRDKLPMLTLWKTLLLSRLDYCSQLWSPTQIGEMQKIEGLQRTFTSYIKDGKDLNYWERLEHLKLYSVERRHERYQIIYAWKIIEDHIVSPDDFELSNINSRTGRKFLIFNPQGASRSALNKLHNTPLYRTMKSFNSLPKKIRNITGLSTENFKYQLDRFISNVPDQPNIPGYKKPALSNSICDQMKYMECQIGGELVVAKSSKSGQEASK